MWYNRFSWFLALLLRRDVALITTESGRCYLRHVIWIKDDGCKYARPYYRFSTSNFWRLYEGGEVSGPEGVRGWDVLVERGVRGIGSWL